MPEAEYQKTSTQPQVCVTCKQPLSEVGVCCSGGDYEDGTHDDATCPTCCPAYHGPEPHGLVYYPRG